MNPAGGGGLFNFGASAATTATPSFGAPQQQQQSTLSFGQTPAAAPATGQTSSFGGGFSFGGAPAPAAGQQQQQPAAAAPTPFSFGQSAANTFAPQATPQTGGLFGNLGGGSQLPQQPQQQQQQQPTLGQPGSLFGSSSTAPTATVSPFGITPLGGGTQTATAAAPSSTGFSFGSTPLGSAPTPAPTPVATSAAAPTGFSFGQTAAAAPSQTTPAATSGFSFGNPAAAASTTTTAQQPTLTLGGGGGLFGTTTTSAAATTTQPPTSLLSGSIPSTTPFSFAPKLGATTTTATTSIPSLIPTSLTSTTATTAAAGLGFGTSFMTSQPLGTTTTAAPTTVSATGLGGVPKYASTGLESSFAFGGGSSSDGKAENRALKELPLPQEMLVLVDELKNEIKSNKMKFTELTRSTNETIISKVTEEIEEVRDSVTVIGNLIHKQMSNCDAIRNLIQQGISNAEMANITRETPLGSQADHKTPIQYFFKLFDSFRERMNIYLREIEKAENSLAYALSAQSAFTSQELFSALKGTRDNVVILSAKVQMLHEEVNREIEAHRNLQRYLLGETKDFNAASSSSQQQQQQRLSSTPRPFTFDSKKDNLGDGTYSKLNVLFPHKLVEPPKCGVLNMSQTLTPGGTKSTSPPAKTSTPYFSRFSSTQLRDHNKPTDSLLYPSNSLFQTQQSTILSSTQLPQSSPISGLSLKRTKH